jgi:hypothetical protein
VIFLVEFDIHDGVTTRKLYVGTHGVRSAPSDTPANQYYSRRLSSVGRLERSMFGSGDGLSGGTTTGQSEVGFGNITVLNGGPGGYEEYIDEWKDYAFRTVSIYSMTSLIEPFSQRATRFVGSVEQLVSTNALEQYDIIIHDRLQDIDKPLLVNTYLGTTTAGGQGTVQGDTDLKDQIKRKVWGTVHNVDCVDVNHFDLVRQTNDGAVTSQTVYDGGVALTLDGDVGTLTALFAATIAPGHYATCNSLGLFRLGTAAQGAVTADVVEGANAAVRTAGQIARRMMQWFQSMYPGTTVTLSLSDVTALDVLNSAECGVVVTDTESALSAIMRVLNSVGAWMLPQSDNATMFDTGRLDLPSGTAIASYDFDDNIGGNPERIESGDDSKGIPAWKVIVKYDQLDVVQTSGELFGVVVENNPLRAQYLATEWRQVSVENTAILTKWPHAPTITIETRLLTQAAAQAECTRLFNIYSQQRDIWRIKVPMSDDPADDPGIGEIVELTSRTGRMGLGTEPGFGEIYRIIGRTDDFDEVPTLTLTLYG